MLECPSVTHGVISVWPLAGQGVPIWVCTTVTPAWSSSSLPTPNTHGHVTTQHPGFLASLLRTRPGRAWLGEVRARAGHVSEGSAETGVSGRQHVGQGSQQSPLWAPREGRLPSGLADSPC